MTEDTPADVAHAASIPDALPLDRLALVGLFSSGADTTALLRTAAGDIVRVAPGDRVGPATITTIDEHRLELSQGGESYVLAMPQDEPQARPHLRGEG